MFHEYLNLLIIILNFLLKQFINVSWLYFEKLKSRKSYIQCRFRLKMKIKGKYPAFLFKFIYLFILNKRFFIEGKKDETSTFLMKKTILRIKLCLVLFSCLKFSWLILWFDSFNRTKPPL